MVEDKDQEKVVGNQDMTGELGVRWRTLRLKSSLSVSKLENRAKIGPDLEWKIVFTLPHFLGYQPVGGSSV